jgi:hypothetical protein
MEETIQELTTRYLEEIYKAKTDEEVEEVLFILFNEGYLHGFSTALKERIEQDKHTLNFMLNTK